MPIPIEQRSDEFIWGLTDNGKFSIKSSTKLQVVNVATHTFGLNVEITFAS